MPDTDTHARQLHELQQKVNEITAVLADTEDDLRKRRDVRRQMRHMRQYLGMLTAVFAGSFTGFGIMAGFVHNTDTAERTSFENRLEARLVSGLATPTLVLRYKDNYGYVKDLDGQTIVAKLIKEKDNSNPPIEKWVVRITYIIQNNSDAISGRYRVEAYTDIFFGGDDTIINADDSIKYKYEYDLTYDDDNKIWYDDLPGHFAASRVLSLWFGQNVTLPPNITRDSVPLLLKIYYGRGQVSHAQINLMVKKGAS